MDTMPKSQAKREVPKGVKAIAIYYYLSAGLSLLIMLALILFTSLVMPWLIKTFASDIEKYMTPSSLQLFITVFLVAMGIMLIISAVFSLIIGIGLWKLKKWARIVAIVSAGLGMLSGGISILFSLISLNAVKTALYTPSLIISVFIFVYLLSDEKVKQAFA